MTGRISQTGLWILLAAGLAAPLAAQTTHFVQVNDSFFSPAQLVICQGDTVQWDWVGSIAHSATSGDGCGDNPSGNGAWDSGVLGAGSSFSKTFDAIPPECATDGSPGDDTCSYYCTVHCGNMDGVITITLLPAAGLALPTNKLRIDRNGDGKGGTAKGMENLEGALFDEIVPDTVEVTLTLTGTDAQGGPIGINDSVMVPTTRGNHIARYDEDAGKDLNIRTVTIRGRKDPDVGAVTLKYETHNVDLTGATGLTLDVEIIQTVPDPCTGGTVDILAADSGPVSL